jgi:hypothetical protein
VREFAISLKEEKHKSRLAMAKLLDDAEGMMADSVDPDTKMSAAELERLIVSDAVQEERRYLLSKMSTREYAAFTFAYNFITVLTSYVHCETKTKERAGENSCGL